MHQIPTAIIPSVAASDKSRRVIQAEFRSILANATLKISGSAKTNPDLLFGRKLSVRHRIDLFDSTFFLTNVIQIPELRFFVAFVVQSKAGRSFVSPRIFYKDLSLCWRSASHYAIENDGDIWIGKGDTRLRREGGYEFSESIESTTDLPLEMQNALESLIIPRGATTGSMDILDWVLKRSPPSRVKPYADFLAERKRAQANPANLINRNRSIASFKRKHEPESLRVKPGYEPDFQNGVLESASSTSRLYGGQLERVRVLSVNSTIQYMFLSSPTHTWLFPPQATTTQLSSFGVRTIDVVADDDLFIPGYEYHYQIETTDGPEWYSQIPEGFAGPVCELDDAKADASPWLNKIPIIQEFNARFTNR